MQGIARQNGGMRYLLTLIDVFSMFALAVPVHSKDAKAITSAFDQVLMAAHPRHPRRLQTDKGKEFFNSDFLALMMRNGIQQLPVTAIKRRPWWNGLIAPSRPGYGYTSRTAALCAGWMSSRTWWKHTITRTTAPSAWRRPMSKRRTRTVYGCAYTETATLTLSHLFPKEPWCGSAGKRQYLTRATCQTGPRSTFSESRRAT